MPPGAVRRRLGSLFEAIERNPGRTIAAVGLTFALAYAGAFLTGASRGHVIRGDAIQYYAYLRSMVYDRDLDFQNEYEHFYDAPSDPGTPNVWLTERTAAGRPPNMMSVGPSLLWAPIYVTIAGLGLVFASMGLAVTPDGFSVVAQLSAGLAGVFYATIGTWLCFRIAARFFSGPTALWAALVAWIGGPAVYYSLVSPTYSHATSLFAVALFVLGWLRSTDRYGWARALGLGALAGLTALVRWQDIIVLALPCWELLSARRRGAVSTFGMGLFIGWLAVGAVAAIVPQLVAWHAVYGTFLVMPQGGSFMSWGEPAILSVLFSTRHGLFLWTPALLVATAGLWWLWRRDRLIGAAAMLTLALAVYVNAAVSDWWAGEAFGARRFVSYAPLFTLGLAALGARLESGGRHVALRAIAVGLIIYNLLFLLQYQLFMRGHVDVVPYPETVRQILLDRLVLPARLLGWWLDG